MMIRLVGFCMAVVFAGFAYLQLNDTDALIWVLAYTLCSVLGILTMLRRVPRNLALTLAIVFLIWALYLIPQTNGMWWDGEIEREVGGLVVACLWSVVAARWGVSRNAS